MWQELSGVAKLNIENEWENAFTRPNWVHGCHDFLVISFDESWRETSKEQREREHAGTLPRSLCQGREGAKGDWVLSLRAARKENLP